MAKRFIPLDEAAKMVGISPDALNELRGRHEISGYRDGASWKFKEEDIEKLLEQRRASVDQSAAEFEELDDNVDSILLSEVELGHSASSTSSTVIGKSFVPPSAEDDIQLAQPKKPSADAGQSDVRLASESDLLGGDSALSTKFDDLDTLDLDMPDAQESGISLGSSAVSLPDDMALGDSTIALDDRPGTADPRSGSGGASAIELASEEDDDLVLGGSSGPGSDITRSAGDSGISLVDPSDSGISLEDPALELGGSSVESLELGEDDQVILEEEGDTEAATLLKADDDFLLTPLEEGSEEADSGSQVIALDEEGEFDTGGLSDTGGGIMLEEDMGGFGAPGGMGAPLGAPGAGIAAAAAPAGMAQAAEPPFSIGNVLSLSLCAVILVLTGMMMSDLLRNMWSWNAPYAVNSPIMDTILGLFGGKT